MATTSDLPTDDWPVYVANPRVDTNAMYRAYAQAADHARPWFGKLSLEMHARPNFKEEVAPVAACFKEVQCSEPGCFRCEAKQGGYKFRWFHPLWEADYLAKKAEEAWDPHETEEVREKHDRTFREKRVLHQEVMRPRMQSFLSALDATGGSMRDVVLELHRKKTGDSR